MATEQEKQTPDVNLTEQRKGVVAEATAVAKAKSMRLRLMKARNENYLAERRDERETDEDVTKELNLEFETVTRRG